MAKSLFTDREYLQTDQYRDPYKLNARINIHERFSTNPYNFYLWIFDQFELPPDCDILEVGCGPGDVWEKNLPRLPVGWRLTLTDFSIGMVEKARHRLQTSEHPFRFAVADVQDIPFPTERFDALIANHMLYHVPDREQAIAEIHRVLRPGGLLYATTNGRKHLQELAHLARRFDPDAFEAARREDPDLLSSENFGLESGWGQLSPWFFHVKQKKYEDGLIVTEPEPLATWVQSWAGLIFGDKVEAFVEFMQNELVCRGVLRFTKEPGIFIAQRA
jgi:SAM-dependent methyltransferase